MPFPRVIEVDDQQCVNCHACIAVCPVKFCNDGSSGRVEIDPESCIGCGHCLKACSHGARMIVDDMAAFLASVELRAPMVAMVAPSVAASFPDRWKRLNTWLRMQGVEAVFDVGFGAELTARSYAEHMKEREPTCMVSSPCPAVVSYISIYQPELIPFLVPYDSPMMHTLKMIRSVFPQYRSHSTVIISPCIAKKREFSQSGLGDFNITMASLNKYFQETGVDLDTLDESDFDHLPATYGALFSSPGGLMRNMEPYVPGISWMSRRVEGDEAFRYLRQLPASLAKGNAPMLVDCLSCSQGCNGGPGALAQDRPLDELEQEVSKRQRASGPLPTLEELNERLDPYWSEIRYRRAIRDYSANNRFESPTDDDLDMIYQAMLKEGPDDILNCTACGYRSCRDMASAIANGLNRPENCYMYLQKKTQQEHEQMLQAQERFRVMFESSHEAILLCNEQGVTDCNDAACNLFDLTRETLMKMKLFDFFPECQQNGRKSMEVIARQIARVGAKDPVSYEWRMQKGNGDEFLADVRVNRLAVGEGELLHLQMQDVSERNRARQILQESHDYIQALVESVECGILVIDARTLDIIDANSYALRLIKLPMEKVIGRQCRSFVCPAEEHECLAEHAAEREELKECSLIDAGGSMVPVLKTVVRAQLGGRSCFIESFVDISTKKETELALKRARDAAENANRAKSEFLANMSHEIRTPMNGVLGLADLLMDMNLAGEQKELARDIHYSAESLLRVLNDILDISRIEAGELLLETSRFNLIESVKDTARIFRQLAAERGNRLVTHFSHDLPGYYMGDPMRLRQVLVNLLGNAIKFTENGLIELCVDRFDLEDGRCRINVTVRDNGIGIPPGKMNLIFDKFSQADSSTTREYGGTGLGLAICRELVELMGGEISVKSQPGTETEFLFHMYLQPDGTESRPDSEGLSTDGFHQDFSHVKVLLVEDNRVNQVVITKLLERLNCEVVLAENGQEALDRLHEQTFDIVFMDCSMPVMDGFEATRQIRDAMAMKELPVIAVTAHAMQGDNRRCYNAGMNGYIPKPVNRRALHKTLHDYFGKHVAKKVDGSHGLLPPGGTRNGDRK